jgi:hypothetical protein
VTARFWSAAESVPSVSILDFVDFAASEPFRQKVFGAPCSAWSGDETPHHQYNGRDYQSDEQEEHDESDPSAATVVPEAPVAEAAPAVAVIVDCPTHRERDPEDDQPDDKRGHPGRDVESAWSPLRCGRWWGSDAFLGHVDSYAICPSGATWVNRSSRDLIAT